MYYIDVPNKWSKGLVINMTMINQIRNEMKRIGATETRYGNQFTFKKKQRAITLRKVTDKLTKKDGVAEKRIRNTSNEEYWFEHYNSSFIKETVEWIEKGI